ncbi:MAG: hypothetical protein NZ556_00155 [Fimbriimonadales bacterium]|nr:hypothetical protein [Fimbriimonadales bacterium]
MRLVLNAGLTILLALSVCAQVVPSAETLQKLYGLAILQQAFEWHRVVNEYEAEFTLRAYNPVIQDYHRDEFALWLNRNLSITSQLAIRTEMYGQSYTASPAYAQWWEDGESRSIEQPTTPLDPHAAWMGPFGDTAAGAATLDPGYRVPDLWSRDHVRSVRLSQGVHTFQIRNRQNAVETLAYPYWQLEVRTDRYEVVVRVGKDTPILLYYSKAKDGRVFWEETWYPLRWR